MDLTIIDNIIQKGIASGLFPGAALGLVIQNMSPLKRFYGRHTFTPWSRSIDSYSLFDLASLTKPLCTTMATALLVQRGLIDLRQSLKDFFPFVARDKAKITIQHLLTHSSGLKPWMPLYKYLYEKALKVPDSPLDFVCKIILNAPLFFKTGQKAIYSDLGFILLAQIIQLRSGLELWSFVKRDLFDPLGLSCIGSYHEQREFLAPFVPTGVCPFRKRMCWGEVNDLNAWAIGGMPGHAGLYSCLDDLLVLLRAIMDCCLGRKVAGWTINQSTLDLFVNYRAEHPSINWALGFDRPSLRSSSCGHFFSRNSIGHLGYTGTSFWIDLDAGVIVVFLSARTFPFDKPEDKEKMKSLRIALHNEIRKLTHSITKAG